MDTFEERKENLIRELMKLRNSFDGIIRDIDKCDDDLQLGQVINRYEKILKDGVTNGNV